MLEQNPYEISLFYSQIGPVLRPDQFEEFSLPGICRPFPAISGNF